MKKPIQMVYYFSHELDEYKTFVRMSERYWVEECEKYEQSQLEENDDNDELLKRFDYRTDLSVYLESAFPQYQRKSYLVILLSMFEDFLNQLCMSVKSECHLNISYVDFAGSGVDRAKDYLRKTSPLGFPAYSSEWEKIKKAYAIRNVVVHAAGYIDPEKHKNQMVIVSADDYLDSESYARIHLVLSEEYIYELVSTLQSLCTQLCGLIETKLKH
jgi:hypothetical protein